VVFLQDAMPAAVTQFGRDPGGVHDVGEQHRGKDPVRVGDRQRTGQELLGQLDHGVLVTEEREVVMARQLHQPGVGEPLGHVSAGMHIGQPVAGSMQHQHGHVDRPEQPSDVHPGRAT
jgi:hypothetical protein